MFSNKADDISELNAYERAKCPKPDCAFHLPLYHLNNEPKIPKIVDSRAQQWNQASLSSLVETFSWSVHKELFEYGLRSTPIRALHKEPVSARLISYPWLIVEHKKEGVEKSKEETVCCQAANGSACAIQMNKLAARYAVKLDDHEEIPPIPTITTIGKDVKVWITYFGKDFWTLSGNSYTYSRRWLHHKQGYVSLCCHTWKFSNHLLQMMRAIWEGDMTKLDDITNFQLILDNTHTWAMREYKPLMSTYINQWIHIHCRSGIDSANAALVQRQQLTERCQQIVPVVQGILETHSSIELDYSKHSMMTPLLLSLLVKEILSSERLSMVKSLETTISKMLHEKDLRPGETNKKTQASTQDHQREFVQTQETIFSRTTTIDVDNMDDEDYEEPGSNRKPRTVPITSPNSDERRRSSRLNPQLSSPASSASEGSTRLGSTDQNTQDLETPRSEASSQPPATPCSSSAVNPSTDDANQENAGTSSSRIATPVNRSRERSVLEEAASTPRPFSFAYPKGKILDLEGSSPSPEPVKRDWAAGWAAKYGDVSWNFGPVSPGRREPASERTQSPTPCPDPKAQESTSQKGNEGRESTEIEDSQESP